MTRLGGLTTQGLLSSTDAELRADGFSRQKARYVRVLSSAIEDGSFDLDAVAALDDESARIALVALPGIGPWTAEVYLLSALRRRDMASRGHCAAGGCTEGPRSGDTPVGRRAGRDRGGVEAAWRRRPRPGSAGVPERALEA